MSKRVLYAIISVLFIAVAGLGYLLVVEPGQDSSPNNNSGGQSLAQQTQTEPEQNEEGFRKYSAEDVVNVLKSADLSVQNVSDKEIGGTSAPATEVQAKEFTIASIAPEGGQILIFADQKGLDAKKQWFDRFPDLAPYVYINGNAMIQLNSGLPAQEAAKYEKALESL